MTNVLISREGKRSRIAVLSGVCLAVLGLLVLVAINRDREVRKPLLTACIEGQAFRIENGQAAEYQDENRNQFMVELDDQFYELESISLHFTVNEWHTVAFLDETLNVLEWDEARSGDYTFKVNKKAKYFFFTALTAEAAYLKPEGILSKAGEKEKAKKEEEESPFSGKYLSVLGDSLSALEYYVPTGYFSVYPADGVTTEYMWWHQLAKQLDMEICKINACGGSGVTVYSWANEMGMAAIEGRGSKLHSEGQNPDIIIVWIGGNDVLGGAPREQIEDYYRRMIKEVTESYPDAEIYLCTYYPLQEQYVEEIQWLNQEIQVIAEEFGGKVLHTGECGMTLENQSECRIDDLHPDGNGHWLIAQKIQEDMLDQHRQTQ